MRTFFNGPCFAKKFQMTPKHRRITDIATWSCDDGMVNVVVEIPAGHTAKIEYNPESHKWAMDRVVDYLPYPVNYGFLPSTLAGDGDPLDVLLLGNTVGSGAVVQAIPIGIMPMVDNGKPDDKIIAVPPHGMSPMADRVGDVPDLEKHYPGVIPIIQTWFRHYKHHGSNDVQIGEFKCKEEAVRAIKDAQILEEDAVAGKKRSITQV